MLAHYVSSAYLLYLAHLSSLNTNLSSCSCIFFKNIICSCVCVFLNWEEFGFCVLNSLSWPWNQLLLIQFMAQNTALIVFRTRSATTQTSARKSASLSYPLVFCSFVPKKERTLFVLIIFTLHCMNFIIPVNFLIFMVISYKILVDNTIFFC